LISSTIFAQLKTESRYTLQQLWYNNHKLTLTDTPSHLQTRARSPVVVYYSPESHWHWNATNCCWYSHAETGPY